MIFGRKKEKPGEASSGPDLLLARGLMKKNRDETDSLKKVERAWKILEKLAGWRGDHVKWGDVFRKLTPHLAEIPHATRQEILEFPGIHRLATLSPTLSYGQNLSHCSVKDTEFKKAQARLNRFRGHIGGSSALSLEGVQAVLLYLLLLAGLNNTQGEQRWIRDSVEHIEPISDLLTESLLRVFEKKYHGEVK